MQSKSKNSAKLNAKIKKYYNVISREFANFLAQIFNNI